MRRVMVAASAMAMVVLGAVPAHAQSDDRMIAPVAEATVDGREHACMTEAIYREAGAEPVRGRMAVAQVIMNRTRSGSFPSSVCAVTHQRGQFTFPKNAGPRRGPGEARLWTEARSIASLVLRGVVTGVSDRALYFRPATVRAGFGARARLVEIIGRHAFYAPR